MSDVHLDATCNCAVAVRSGDDIILIDGCGPNSEIRNKRMRVNVYKNGDLTEGTRLFTESNGRVNKV